MKPLTKKQKIKNCMTFLKRWKNIPDANVSKGLSCWRSESDKHAPHTCNTIACAGGWLSSMPEFRKMGVVNGIHGEPKLGDLFDPYDVSHYLFGDWLFGRNFSHDLSDHDTVTQRFTQQVEELRRIKFERN